MSSSRWQGSKIIQPQEPLCYNREFSETSHHNQKVSPNYGPSSKTQEPRKSNVGENPTGPPYLNTRDLRYD